MTLVTQKPFSKILLGLRRLGLAQKDFSEKFSRSSGKGGQNVNKVETAVTVTHAPTGLSAKCQAQRVQGANRLQAWTMLLSKIEEQQKRQQQAKITHKEKLRRQKRGRSHKGKEEMLANKKIRSHKKLARSRNFYRLDV